MNKTESLSYGSVTHNMKTEVKNLQDELVDVELLRQALGAAVQTVGREIETLSLVLVDDSRISEINRSFLGRSEPTDVIAFGPDEEDELTGEVIVSVETAARQAQEQGHTLDRELCILAVHGLLHTLGYDDTTERSRAEMDRLQVQIADTICPLPWP